MREIIENIIRYATMAPSGDNSQPWRFVVKGSTILIYNIVDRDIPLYNHEQKGSLVAHGALLENLIIAAAEYGYLADFEILPVPEQPELVARVILKNTTVQKDALFKYLEQRSTNRRFYDTTPLTVADRSALINEANKFNGISLKIIESPHLKKEICEASIVNEITVLTTRVLHDIFFDHVVWTEAEERHKRTGLYLATLELGKLQQKIFYFAKNWNFLRIANMLGLARKIASDNAHSYASSSALLVLTTDKDIPVNFFQTGRLMERLWLQAAKLGYAAHPVTGVFFLHQRISAGQAVELAPKTSTKVIQAYKKIQKLLSCDNQTITMMLRIGRASSPSGRSSRMFPAITFI